MENLKLLTRKYSIYNNVMYAHAYINNLYNIYTYYIHLYIVEIIVT